MWDSKELGGFPGNLVGKESSCNAGDPSSIPGLRRSTGEGLGYPFQYSGLENSRDCRVHGVAKNQTWQSDFHFHFIFKGTGRDKLRFSPGHQKRDGAPVYKVQHRCYIKKCSWQHVYYLGWNRSPAQIGCMRQALGPGALGRPRGIGWRGRWEGGSGWGTHVNPWLIHFNVWQNPLQYCKVISLQLIKKNKN